MIEIPDYVYDRIIKDLQRCLDVCLDVDYASDEIEKTASYANGYSRATMESVIQDLNRYKDQSN